MWPHVSWTRVSSILVARGLFLVQHPVDQRPIGRLHSSVRVFLLAFLCVLRRRQRQRGHRLTVRLRESRR
jgi:hypothetical protein